MKTIWTSNLKTDDEKERFKRSLLASRSVFDRLTQIIEDKERVINSMETGVEIYERPGWEALMVHYNSEKGVYQWLKELINLDPKG